MSLILKGRRGGVAPVSSVVDWLKGEWGGEGKIKAMSLEQR
jgi:hypothetical protein